MSPPKTPREWMVALGLAIPALILLALMLMHFLSGELH
jgi:hypothetical protein